MNRILDLKQKRAAALTSAGAVLELAARENRATTAEENQTYDRAYAEALGFKETIDREERQTQVEKLVINSRQQRKEEQGAGDVDEQREAFIEHIRWGNEMDPELRSKLFVGSGSKLDFGKSEKRAAQSAVTGNVGGYVVPQGFYAEVITALKYYSGMMEVGPTIIDTSMGNDLPVPTSNDSSNTGAILAESSPETSLEIPFGQVIMKAYKYSSRLILVPIELLQDAGVDIEAYVVKMLAIRLGRILNTHFTSGSGTSQPRGVLADAVTGKTGAGGQVTTIIYDDIVDLKYSVNRSYRGNGRWMMNDSTLQYILKIKDQNLRPLILDYLTTLQEGEPERLLGQPLIVNNDMPALGTTGSPAVGNQSLLYGDFSNYWVRRVMAMLLLRLVERFAEAGQVAFVAFLRMDGRMIDAGTHPIKAYVNPTA
jgi:HK97 family phage major capsid protein